MNDITLKGRLTRDPEIRFFNGDKLVCNFAIAVNRSWQKEGQPNADFFDCKAFGKISEFIGERFNKGQEILLKGEMQRSSWDDNEGKKRYKWECVVSHVEFCGSKADAQKQTEQSNSTAPDGFTPIDESVEDDDLPF